MNEELERLVSVLQAQGASMSEIQNAIAQYKQTNQGEEDSSEEEVPTGPTLDADGINVDLYVNSTFWESTGLDRESYFDEEGQLVDPNAGFAGAVPDLGYIQIKQELETKNVMTREAVSTEETDA